MLHDSLQKQPRDKIKQSRRWIVKLGSALLTANGLGLDQKAIAEWVRQIAYLRSQGIEIIVVSSGAIAAGMVRLGWPERPSTVHELQAAAAVGQADLVKTYEQAFAKHDLHTAQILLDHDDFSDRTRYLNARSTLKTLLDLNVIPVVNENDTVVTDEIRFGDNDSLAALVANAVEADYLVILTDQLGMYDSDPRTNSNAVMLDNVNATDPALVAMAGGGGRLGRGGMATKVKAAKIAARAGAHTLIVGGSIDEVLLKFYRGEAVGSLLLANEQPQAARKQWLAGHLQVKGELTIDNGAARFLRDSGKSLLPVGVTQVKGDFNRGDMVICCNLAGREVARGIANYSALETEKIIGQPSHAIEKLLGYKDEDELIHRDNLVLSEG